MSSFRSTSTFVFCCSLLLHAVACQTVCAQIQYPSLTIPQYQPAPIYESQPVPGSRDAVPESYAPPQAGDFSITVRTELLTPFVNRESVESDNVATRVMEADVRGVQTTATSVRLTSLTSNDNARLNIQSTGTVSSNTIGYTRQAQVATLGSHNFNVIKPVFFDGRRFLTKQAYGSLQVRQVPQAVTTVASGMPLFGPIGERMAWNEVYRRMPISDSIVARRVADDVVPRVNSSVDTKLVELNQQLKKIRNDLEGLSGIERLEWSASSTQQSFSMTALNQSVENRRADPKKQLLSELSTGESAAVVFSEDGLNHLLARQPIAGLTIPDAAFPKLIQAFQNAEEDSKLMLSSLKEGLDLTAEPILFSVKLASERPIQISLKDGLFALLLKFQILPKVGELSQIHLMKIRLGGKNAANGTWAVSVKDVSVEPASSNELPDSWTKLIGTQAKQMMEGLPPTELKRQIDLRRFHEKLPVLRIHRIQTQNAQLRVSFRPGAGSAPRMIGRPGMFGP